MIIIKFVIKPINPIELIYFITTNIVVYKSESNLYAPI